jgi:LuxR family maltose regulon positive regulatory protein
MQQIPSQMMHPPAASSTTAGMVSRAALLDILEQSSTGTATLIEAGPGYGKTQLALQWQSRLHARGEAVIYLNALAAFAEPCIFLSALWQACLDHPELAPLAQASKGKATTATSFAFLEDFTARVTIIVDHYDKIANTRLDETIADFVTRFAENIHLVVLSRAEIDIPFGRHRLRSGTKILTQDMLRFTAAEASTLCAGSSLMSDLAQILKWSEGWPIAIDAAHRKHCQMAIDGMNISDLLDDAEAEIHLFLKDEILSGLDPLQENILVETSIFREFSCDLVDAIVGEPHSWKILDDLHAENLVLLTENRQNPWYRCHGILQRVLQLQLSKRGQREIARLHLAAARWFRDDGKLIDAITHACAAKDMDLVADLILSIDVTMVGVSYGMPELKAVLEHVPPEAFQRFPRLILAQAFVAAKTNNLDVAAALVKAVRTGAGDNRLDDPLFARDIAIAEAAISMFGGRGLSPTAQENIEKMEAGSRGDQNTHALVNNLLGVIALNTSHFPEALSRCRVAMHFYAGQKSPNGLGYMHIHTGRVYAEMGETEKAIEHYNEARRQFLSCSETDDRSLRLVSMFLAQSLYDFGHFDDVGDVCASIDQPELGGYYHEGLYAGYRTIAMMRRCTQGVAEAISHLDEGIDLARSNRLVHLECLLSLDRLLLEPDAAIFLRDVPKARELVDLISVRAELEPWRIRDLKAMVAARQCVVEGRVPEALACLRGQAAECERHGRVRTHVEFLIRIALAEDAAGERGVALGSLKKAIGQASRGGIVAPFLENGLDAIALLTSLSAATAKDLCPREQAFLSDILRLYGKFQTVSAIFSTREIDVLRYMSHGLSNKLIARTLNISPETVRFHLKGIYQKFGVKSGNGNRKVVADLMTMRGMV